MRLRRRADLERVRVAKRNLPTLSSDFAADIIRLRRSMYRAVNQLNAGSTDAARKTLTDALSERWWR